MRPKPDRYCAVSRLLRVGHSEGVSLRQSSMCPTLSLVHHPIRPGNTEARCSLGTVCARSLGLDEPAFRTALSVFYSIFDLRIHHFLSPHPSKSTEYLSHTIEVGKQSATADFGRLVLSVTSARVPNHSHHRHWRITERQERLSIIQ